MIKILITDLVNKKTTLSDALTKAKLISLEIDSDIFKNWLRKELEGYDFDDSALPSYRKIYSPLNVVAIISNGQEMSFPIFAPDNISDEEKSILEIHRVLQPISAIEKHLEDFKESSGRLNVPAKLYQTLYQFLTEREKKQIILYQARISGGYREVGKVQLNNILEMTKQKLIDTLIDFSKEFPDIMNNFQPNEKNNEKVQNIVTNNIYGGTNPMNLAVGLNVNQHSNTINLSQDEIQKLDSLGVEKDDINKLNEIINNTSEDKSNRTKKIMTWLV